MNLEKKLQNVFIDKYSNKSSVTSKSGKKIVRCFQKKFSIIFFKNFPIFKKIKKYFHNYSTQLQQIIRLTSKKNTVCFHSESIKRGATVRDFLEREKLQFCGNLDKKSRGGQWLIFNFKIQNKY